MDFGTIERELYVEATPETVFDVVSDPSHVRQWWPDDAHYDPTPGSVGEISFGERDAGGQVVSFTVVEARRPHTFSFRWTNSADQAATETNSLLVTFDLRPSGAGTVLRLTETGFREQGWEAAVLEQQYQEHVTGWDFFLPRLATYAATLPVRP